MKKFIIIDGNAILHRAWHALPPLTSKNGQLVNAAYGFTMILIKALKDLKPYYGAVTFDRKEKTFRHEEYAEYKAQRPKQPDELYAQIPIIKDIVKSFNLPIYELSRYEADDLIATICANKKVNIPEIETIVITGDMDTLQLIDDNTKVCALRKGVTDTVLYDENAVKEKYGLTPKQLIDFKALRGDPSDNIPGARGIGEVGAVELVKQFESIENLYSAIESNDSNIQKIKPRTLEILKNEKKNVLLGKKLVTLILDAPIDFNLEDCKLNIDPTPILKTLEELGFNSLIGKVNSLAADSMGKQGNLF
jgi:DNA polymerase-1